LLVGSRFIFSGVQLSKAVAVMQVAGTYQPYLRLRHCASSCPT